GIDRHRGAQIDQRLLEAVGAHVVPPVDVTRMPAFERLQDAAILGEVDVVWNFFAIVDVDDVHGASPFSCPGCGAGRSGAPPIRDPAFFTQPGPGSAAHHFRAALRPGHANHTLLVSNTAFWPVPYRFNAPVSPTALGRWKIQFCQAVSRAKIFDSIVSGPPKRRFASMPVSASGEKLARSSRNTRISSSQSMSSS